MFLAVTKKKASYFAVTKNEYHKLNLSVRLTRTLAYKYPYNTGVIYLIMSDVLINFLMPG